MLLITSVLGVYDGNAYENLWKMAQEALLNQPEAPDCYEVSSLHVPSMGDADIRIRAGERQADAST